MNKLNNLNAATHQELIDQLKSIDISVPPRTEGRKTHHTEIWSITRLLATLCECQKISFPFALSHRDKPDFLVNLEHLIIGIEVTESIPQKYAEFCALAEREFPSVPFDNGHFRWDMEVLTKNEMRAILTNPKNMSPPLSGDLAELEWAVFIKESVDGKLVKLANVGFDKFDQNWLTIYDNLPIHNINLEKAIGFLKDLLKDSWGVGWSFDAIFIERGPVIVKVTADSSEHLKLKDVW